MLLLLLLFIIKELTWNSTSRETKQQLGRDSNPRPFDHEADTLPLHHYVSFKTQTVLPGKPKILFWMENDKGPVFSGEI
jgi:hypothetical protein